MQNPPKKREKMKGGSSRNNNLFVDDSLFSFLSETDEEEDDDYVHKPKIHSLFSVLSETDQEEDDDDDDHKPKTDSDFSVLLETDEEEEERDHKPKKRKAETGDSSKTFCPICMEAKPTSKMFKNTNCPHQFCLDCITKHVAVKIQENISTVKCPDLNCSGVLHLEHDFCRQILPPELFDRWENVVCESMILASEKFYCPFKDCSAMLVDDGGERVIASECPSCHRLFCAQCKVSWHSGLECGEFQRLEKEEREDVMLMKLADKKWRRCPNCKFYVEKVNGCLHISCRCGWEFCYGCGSTWTKRSSECRCTA